MEKLTDNNLDKNTIDLTGRKFDKLLVLGLDHKEKSVYSNGKKRVFYYWKCRCDCGKEVVRSGNSLRSGATKSCGCNQREKNKLTHNLKKAKNIKTNTRKIDLTGKVFGKLLVLKLDYKKEIVSKSGKKRIYYYWQCMCECGNEVVREGNALRRGATTSCGCYKFYKQQQNMNKKKYQKQEKEIEEEFE